LLKQRDLAGLDKWAYGTAGSMSILLTFIYNRDELTAWRAVEALGEVADYLWELERTREIIRRLFWSMNDESGSLGWYAPQAVGEILYRVHPLMDEFGRILASLHGQEPFREGVFWGMSRMSSKKPAIFADMVEELQPALEDPLPSIRAHAALVLAGLKAGEAREKIESLLQDRAEFRVYDFSAGVLKTETVADYAKRALERY